MKNLRTVLLLACLILSGTGLAADNGLWVEGKDRPEQRVNRGLKEIGPSTFIKIADRVNEAVVNISSTTVVKPRSRSPHGQRPGSPFHPFFGDDFFERFFGGPQAPRRERRQQSLGSGFILSGKGFIVTNNHVVAKADEIKVVLSDESEFTAKVIGRDPKTDVALLKIDPGKKKLKYVVLGDSDKLKVGEVVVAIGNPFGLSHSVTQGIVSAKERSIGAGAYDDFIQTDASINPGNSGGPLVNLQGEVIGINTAIVASGQGIGFAIPVNLAKNILLKLNKDGKVVRGWLGVMIQKITDEHATAFNLPSKKGALVADVQDGSPAERAGLKKGDVVVKVAGKTIGDWHDLPITIANIDVGKTVPLVVIRDGKRKTINVKIGELKDEKDQVLGESEGSKKDPLGLAVQTLTPEIARSLGMSKNTKGVVVSGIDGSKMAYRKGVRRGDVILEVNRAKVPNVKRYRAQVQKLKKGKSVLLLIRRGRGQQLFIAFKL